MKFIDLYNGNCLEVMKSAPDNSIDAVVTDPPYGLSFMGKKWDYDVPSVEIWKEVFRVLKPGGHLLAFGGTRTYHRLAVNVEDAGFEIRDQIQWLYGQGFPKSLDVSKAIDKAAGAEREVVGPKVRLGDAKAYPHNDTGGVFEPGGQGADGFRNPVSNPSTDAAKQWEGWGTALKPANEPIVLARKPLEKGLTVAQNVQKWGTGAINIDGCRIEAKPRKTGTISHSDKVSGTGTSLVGSSLSRQQEYDLKDQGRFPANVLLDERAAELLDEQTGELRNGGSNKTSLKGKGMFNAGSLEKGGNEAFVGDSGGASRFFYCAKASTSERNSSLRSEGGPEKNTHPTVKPIKLMEYLCRLITPPGGIVLDPFMGSGTTGIAAGNEGFGFVGIEMNSEYFEIAKKRIGHEEDEAA